MKRRTFLKTLGAAFLVAGLGIGFGAPTPSDSPWINVRDHGAIGDGRHDDTDAILAAIDEAEMNGGGMVALPSGVYNVRQDFLPISLSVSLRGEAPPTTMIRVRP